MEKGFWVGFRAGKPYVPGKKTGTLALNIVKLGHTLIYLICSFKLGSIAIPDHFWCFQLKKLRSRRRSHAWFVNSLLLQRNRLPLLQYYYSSTTELTPREMVNCPVAVVAYRVMRDRHTGRYGDGGTSVPRIEANDDLVGSTPLTILSVVTSY